MVEALKLVFELYGNIINWFEKKDMDRWFQYILTGICVLLLIPLLLLAFYNIPTGDDYGHIMGSHIAWMKDPSFIGFCKAFGAAWDRMTGIYHAWGGNYSSFFFSSFQPVAFSERLNFIGTFLFLGGLIWGEFVLIREIFGEYFHFEKKAYMVVMLLIFIMQTQWLTSGRQAFYWYSGCVTNTLGFAASLGLLTIFIKVTRLKIMKKRELVGSILLAIFIGGCNYSSLMSLFVILFFYYIDLFGNKEIERCLKIKLAAVGIVLFVGSIISIVAPGNAARQLNNPGSSAPKALLSAIISGKDIILQYTDYKVIIMFLLLTPIIWNYVKESEKYKLPGLVLILSCGILCAALCPTMKSDSNIGPRRTRNLYWWIYLNMMVINYTYFCGWLKYRLSQRKYSFVFKTSHKVAMIAVIGILGMCTVQRDDIVSMPSVRATMELVSGRAEKFGQDMQDRYDQYYSDDTDITVHYIEYAPPLIIEDDGIFANEIGQVYDGYYYGKNTITVVE